MLILLAAFCLALYLMSKTANRKPMASKRQRVKPIQRRQGFTIIQPSAFNHFHNADN